MTIKTQKPFIDKEKFTEVGIAIFGVLSVYVIHNIIYQRLIMAPFKNSASSQKQYFHSQAGFVFLQKTFAWIFAQLFAFFVIKKQIRIQIPIKYTSSSGFFVFLSSILFTTGIYQLSFRLSFSNRSSTYLIATLIGYLICPFTSPTKSPKFRDIFFGLGIGLGVIIFWSCGQDVWVYTPTKNGYIYNWMVISSGICDGIMAILQARVSEKYKPNEIELLLRVSRWTVLWSFGYVLMIGDIQRTVQFCYFHNQWGLSVLGIAFLYFIGQIFIYRMTTRMAQNVPSLITTSSKVLAVHQSYALSNHHLQSKQLIGMIIAWMSIFVQALLLVKREDAKTIIFQEVPRDQPQMSLPTDRISIQGL